MSAKDKALEWCGRNPGWVRECDLEVDVSELYQTWDGVSEKDKQELYDTCGMFNAYLTWRDFGAKKFKVPHVFIDEFGDLHETPHTLGHKWEVMSVFKIDEL